MKHLPFLTKAVTVATLLLAGLAPAENTDMSAVIGMMPAQNASEAKTAFEAVVKGGKPAMLSHCGNVLAPGTGDDHKVRYLLGGLAFHVTRPGAAAEERQDLTAAMLETLQKVQDKQIKSFFMGLLRWCGGPECLAPLGACLTDPDLVEPTTQALLAIKAPGTAEVLLKALKDADGDRAMTLVKALGELRADNAIPMIARFATSTNTNTRRTALQALADIVPSDKNRRTGEGSPCEILKKACQSNDPLEKALVTALLLHHAQRLAESGATSQGAALCREVASLAMQQGPEYLAPAALDTLAGIAGKDAIPDLVKAMGSSNRMVSVAAMKTLISLKPPKADAQLEKLLTRGDVHLRLALLATLTDAERAAHFDAIASNLGNEDQDMRHATIQAMATSRGFPLLLEHLQSGNTNDLPEVKKAILLAAGPKDMKAVAAAMAKAPVSARLQILDILAQRRATSCFDAVAAAASDADPSIRLAAMKALGPIAMPEQLPKLTSLLLKVSDAAEQAAVMNSVILASKAIPEVEKRAESLLAVFPSASPEKKVAIIGTLSMLGGQKALDTLTVASQDADKTIRNAAMGALANWPDASAAGAMLDAAKRAPDLTQQVLLLRGYVRVVRAGSQPPDKKLGMYSAALAEAKRPDEKKLILGALVDIKNIDALLLLDKYLDDPEIRDEAAALAVLVGCANGDYKGLSDPAARPVLSRLAAIVKDENTRKKVEAQITGIK